MTSDCFVMMPIKTQVQFIESYQNDSDHFSHVYDCLFAPAVRRAGFEPVSPAIDGGELIHAALITHLRSASLVLCDISTLNPNVFFELGVRTALDRPVALVRDQQTPTVPFDTQMIHCHEYDPSLSAWKIENEIVRLAAHLEKVAANTDGRNSMWRSLAAADDEQRQTPVALVDEDIEMAEDILVERAWPYSADGRCEVDPDLLRDIVAITAGISAVISVQSVARGRLVLDANGYLIDARTRSRLDDVAERYGVYIDIVG